MRSTTLKVHLRTHSGNKSCSFSNPSSDNNSFTESLSLSSHPRSHTIERETQSEPRFKTNVCNDSPKREIGLSTFCPSKTSHQPQHESCNEPNHEPMKIQETQLSLPLVDIEKINPYKDEYTPVNIFTPSNEFPFYEYDPNEFPISCLSPHRDYYPSVSSPRGIFQISPTDFSNLMPYDQSNIQMNSPINHFYKVPTPMEQQGYPDFSSALNDYGNIRPSGIMVTSPTQKFPYESVLSMKFLGYGV